MTVSSITVETIGVIHSPYKEKFAVPRQPGLVTALTSRLEFLPPYNDPHCIRGIEDFSHLWLMFVFNQNDTDDWHPTVRPPRLGGNQRVGVFASRSPFRPNPIGLSVVQLIGIHHEHGKLWLELGGVDLVDQTPIIDVKPYVPFVDSIPDANGGFAPEPPVTMAVQFDEQLFPRLHELEMKNPGLTLFIEQVIGQDPRPAYRQQTDDAKMYGVRLLTYNVNWQVRNNTAVICSITDIE